jgi:hypothetical protein
MCELRHTSLLVQKMHLRTPSPPGPAICAFVNEYAAFCNGPVDVNCSPIVTPPLTLLSVVGAEAATLCCQKER